MKQHDGGSRAAPSKIGYCPMFNPFEKGILEGRERVELVAVIVLLAVFVVAVSGLAFWMAIHLPANGAKP